MESPANKNMMSRPFGRRELLGGAAKVTAASAFGLLLAGSASTPARSETFRPVSAGGAPAFDPAVASLLADIRHGDNAARQSAAVRAALVGTAAIVPLGLARGDGDLGAAKAASEAIQRIVHNASRPGAAEERQAAARQLVALTDARHPREVRADALRLLGIVGGPTEVVAIADLLHVPALREDARMALERIPAPSAEAALRNAARTVPADYRPAIAQSLRSRSRARQPREVGLRS